MPPLEKYNDFRKALQFALKWEGGYSNDPDDPGKETKWGISKKAHPDLDIANLSPVTAAKIYEKEYWEAAGCDLMPYPLNIVVFDTAVNCGVSRAIQWAKVARSVEDYFKLRREYYIGIINKNPRLSKYLRGWWNRMADLAKLVEIARFPN
jgi:lysozyme family protein